ncbi:MAG: hypothetical protein AMK74_00520 [Nitrospira bacterium SM23_35]|nr:MAG: hypothetical protein AMK74_00520 [Nitrospira bacterium SM23_35]
MAGRTIFIGLRMADLTACLTSMNPMGYHILCFSAVDPLVATETFWPVFHLVPVCVILAITMHFLSSVTLFAFHILFPVDIWQNSFILTKIFLLYATPVARSTDLLHGGFLLKEVTIQKPPFNGSRSADVTLATTAVAVITMVIHCAFYFVADDIIGIGPFINY